MRTWRLVNWAWGLFFVTVGIMILVRSTDGTGAVQTWSTRLVALAILAIFLVLVILIQWGWQRFIKRHPKL
ncbi:DUF3923 family protein [Lactiplantibacillus daowaiensis]|uniref:DUF3923 family protein n=1 Tax=Lactiplantibacillus daowaiensis TaxID=2559918 RepID=A0ABW1S310_9LACO